MTVLLKTKFRMRIKTSVYLLQLQLHLPNTLILHINPHQDADHIILRTFRKSSILSLTVLQKESRKGLFRLIAHHNTVPGMIP